MEFPPTETSTPVAGGSAPVPNIPSEMSGLAARPSANVSELTASGLGAKGARNSPGAVVVPRLGVTSNFVNARLRARCSKPKIGNRKSEIRRLSRRLRACSSVG